MTERYKVLEGSQSAHCCFAYTIIDSQKPTSNIRGEQYYENIAEVFERADADAIAKGLNAEDTLAKVAAENAMLREALAFYGDPDSYVGIGFMVDRPAGEFADDASNDETGYPRPGKRARELLATLAEPWKLPPVALADDVLKRVRTAIGMAALVGFDSLDQIRNLLHAAACEIERLRSVEVRVPVKTDEPLHEDLKLALGFRIHGEVVALVADAFIRRHKEDGWTLEDVATRMGMTRDEVIAFMQMPEDPPTDPDDLNLAEMAALFEAMGARMAFKMVDPMAMQPPWLRDGDGI